MEEGEIESEVSLVFLGEEGAGRHLEIDLWIMVNKYKFDTYLSEIILSH